LSFAHKIPAENKTHNNKRDRCTNPPEKRLKAMLIRASFPDPEQQKRIYLEGTLNYTDVDFFYDLKDHGFRKGICIYLDGLHEKNHGNREQDAKDRLIRNQLTDLDYEPIVITYTDLDAQSIMASHFYKIGYLLCDQEFAKTIRDHPEKWYNGQNSHPEEDSLPPKNMLDQEPDAANSWEEIHSLIDEKWLPLSKQLEQAGVIAPYDCHIDISVNNVVSDGKNAILLWRIKDKSIILVENENSIPGYYTISISSNSEILYVVKQVKQFLENL
jgi:hypothetical protein